jgi:hypothetical protein
LSARILMIDGLVEIDCTRASEHGTTLILRWSPHTGPQRHEASPKAIRIELRSHCAFREKVFVEERIRPDD